MRVSCSSRLPKLGLSLEDVEACRFLITSVEAGCYLIELVQVLEGAPQFFENVGSDRAAPVIMVGPTASGRMLVVPIQPTGRRGVWRPVTAFEANAHHKRRYAAEGGQR